MKARVNGLLGLGAICAIGTLAPAAAQGHGNGHGNGGGGGGGGTPASPAIVYEDGGDLMIMDADGANPTLVASGVAGAFTMEPCLSPDGGSIAFKGSLAPIGEGIYRVGIDGSGLELVTPLATAYVYGPQWSPVATAEGKARILFVDEPGSPGGNRDLFLVDPDGGDLVNLTQTPGVSEDSAAWSPAGDALVVTSVTGSPECWIYELDLIGDALAVVQVTSLIDLPGSPLRPELISSVSWPDWSRGGGVIAVSVHLKGQNGSTGTYWDVWLIDLAAPAAPLNLTGPVLGFANERMPSWSPDDSQLVFARDGDGGGKAGVYTIDLATLAIVRLDRGGRAPDWKR